jgi:hypothetical protein
MMVAVRALLLLALWGCPEGDPASCRLDPIARADVRNQAAVDCGAFSLDGDGGFNDVAMREAHACVLAAVTAAQPFTLFYDVWDRYRHVRGGFTGAVEGGKYQTRSYAYVGDSLGGSLDPRPVLTVQACLTIEDSGCAPTAGIPCLRCVDPSRAATLCRY